MKVEHVDFLVEEPSMEVFLRAILPRIIGDLDFSIHPFQCKKEAAQAIAPHIDPARNVSHSFQVFRDAALHLAGCI